MHILLRCQVFPPDRNHPLSALRRDCYDVVYIEMPDSNIRQYSNLINIRHPALDAPALPDEAGDLCAMCSEIAGSF